MSPQRKPSGSGGARRGGRGEYARKYTPRRKVCAFCVDKISYIDYKDVPRLRRYLSERGKIEPRRKTGTCAKHQRALAVSLKRARHVALMPYTAEHIRLSGMVMRSHDDRRRDDRGPRGGFGRPAPAPAAAPDGVAPADGSAPSPPETNGAAAPGTASSEGAADGTVSPSPGAPAPATALTEGDAIIAAPANTSEPPPPGEAASEAGEAPRPVTAGE